jgi:hypothetical protein
MAELREKRRSTTDVTEKANIRTEMDTQVAKHRSDVKALLKFRTSKNNTISHMRPEENI